MSQHQSVVEQTPITDWNSSIEITLPNLDTTTRRNIALVVRYRPSWISEDIEIAIETIAPDSVSITDTLQLRFRRHQSPRGEALIESIAYRQNSVWRQEGNYRVIITPTDKKIEGVEAVGINITPNKDITIE